MNVCTHLQHRAVRGETKKKSRLRCWFYEMQWGRERKGDSSRASCGLQRYGRFGLHEALQFPKVEEGDLEKVLWNV